MFESLLLKLLQQVLEKYVQGLNSQNLKLGVWSGNVVIENVSIKPEVLDMFEIPIGLKFSSIGKLSLQVPWSSLSSSPVEVLLERVFIIISAKQQNEWKFVDYNTIMKKLELINSYAKTCVQKFLEKEKTLKEGDKPKSQDQAGYLEKMKLRILDNLQVTIKSIHVRFENEGIEGLHSELRYSWGLTLDRLEIYTTDEKWEKAFFDRTDPKNRGKLMNKLLKLGSFCVYWNSSDPNLLSEKPVSEISARMTDLIKRAEDKEPKNSEVISINSEIRLIQNYAALEKFDAPEFTIDISLAAINTNLQKSQLQEIIHLMDYFNVYHTQLMERRRTASIVSVEDKARHEKVFVVLYEQVLRAEEKGGIDALAFEERQQLQDILSSEPIEDIFPWVKVVAKKIQKDQKLLEIEQKKEKEAKGWFGGWWGGSQEKVEVSEDEKSQLEKFLEDNFSDEALKVSNVLKPKDWVWFKLGFRLAGGSITLSDLTQKGDEDGVRFQFKGMGAELLQRGERNLEFGLKVMEFDIDMITKYKESKSYVTTSFLRKNEWCVEKEEAFMALKFEKCPNDVPAGEVTPDSQITLINKSAKVVYNPIATKRLIDFFDVKLESDDLKDAAWKQIEKINDATKVMQTQTIMKLDVVVESPYIVVPFQADNAESNECWLINLGTLHVRTNEFLLRSDVEPEKKIYDMYDVQLQDFKMTYFSTVTSLNKTLELKSEMPEDSFSVVPGFTTSVSANILKSAVGEILTDKPSMVLKVSMPRLALNLSPQIYQKLLKIQGSLIISEDRDPVEMLQTEQAALMSNAKKIGELWRRHHGRHTWECYRAVLSGSYIYFYEKKNKDNKKFVNYQYIRNCVIKRLNDGDLGMKNVFYLENRYGSVYLSCETQASADSWIELISRYQDDANIQRKGTKKLEKQAAAVPEDPGKVKLTLEYEMERVEVNLFDEDQKSKWFCFSSEGFAVRVRQYPFNIAVEVGLRTIEIYDPLRLYQQESLNYLLGCEPDESKGDFLTVSVDYTDRRHPNYQKVDTRLNVELGAFLLNFKPDTFLKLLAFIKVPKEEAVSQSAKTLKPADTIEIAKADMDENIVVLGLRVFLKRVSLNMVHRKSFLNIAELSISDTEVLLEMRLQELFLGLTMGNLQLVDLTNYPETLYLEGDCKVPNHRRELVGINQESGEKALLTVKFFSYQAGSPKIQKNITSEAIIQLSSLRIDFAMQPVFRILDYVLVQIVAVLTTPEVFDKALEKATSLQTQPKEAINPFEGKTTEKILHKLDQTPNINLDISIKKPIICLKSGYKDQDYLLVDLGDITIRNDRTKVERSKGSRPLYCDFYRIWMKDMGLRVIRGSRTFEMSRPFHFNLEVEKPCFAEEYRHCYPGEDLDFSLRIRSRILPIILSLHKTDYLLIMKILFANISYDDMMDRYHIHDWAVSQVPAPAVKNDGQKQLEAKKPQLSFALDIDDITIFIMNPVKKEELNTPLARISFDSLRIIFVKTIASVLNLEVYGETLTGAYYEKGLDHCLFGEFRFPKPVATDRDFSLSKLPQEMLPFKTAFEYTPAFVFEEFDEKSPKINLKVLLQMYPSGNKDIDISLNTLRVNCHAGVLLTLSQFATMDDSVTPPEPIGKKLLEGSSAEAIAPAVIQEAEQEPAKMVIKIDIQKIMILITCPENKKPLALRGNIFLRLEMQGKKSVDFLQKEVERLRKEKKTVVDYELNRVFFLDLSLSEIELFICQIDEMMTGEHQIVKRNILLPLNLAFVMNTYLAWTEQGLFFSKNKNQVVFKEKTVFRISYQDIGNIQKIAGYQTSTMAASSPGPAQEEVAAKKKSEVGKKKWLGAISKVQQKIKSERNKEKLLLVKAQKPAEKKLETGDIVGDAKKKGDVMKISDTQFNIFTKDIELVIVNDAGDAFIPVIDINIDKMDIIMKQSILMMNLLTPVTFSVAYYNPQVSRWEPIIERADLLFEMSTNTFQSPRMEVRINTKGADFDEEKKENEDVLTDEYTPLNINVSTQMLGVVMKSLKLMGSGAKVLKVGYQKDDDEAEEEKKEDAKPTASIFPQEEMEYVSPFSIKNETGYEIEVRRERGKDGGRVYILENGDTMNLQVESDRDQLFSADNKDSSRISVALRKTHHVEYAPITGLDLTRVKTTRYALRKGPETADKKPEDQIFLITDVGLDVSTNRRLIKISSPLLFRNRSLKSLVIKILIDAIKTVELVLPVNSWVAIPIDLVNKPITMRYENAALWTDKLSLSKLMSNKSTNSYQVIVNTQKAAEATAFGSFTQSFLMLTAEKEGKGFGKTVVYIDPPFLIKNCTPLDLELQVNCTILNIPKYFKLAPKSEIHEYDVPTSSKLMVSMRLPGFGWSDSQKLYSPNTEFSREFKVQDGDGNSCVVYVYHVESFVGARRFYFHLKGYIINETTYKLAFYGVEKDAKTGKKGKRILAGQGKGVKEEDRNMDLIIFDEGQESVELRDRGNEAFVSGEVPLGSIGDSAVEFQTKGGYLHLGVSSKLLCVDNSVNLYTKVVSFTPRYIFVNMLDVKMGLRQVGTDQCFVIVEKDREPYKWQDNKKPKKIHYTIITGDKPVDWEWSGEIDISAVGRTNFLLRMKAQPAFKYMKAEILNDQGLIYIIIDEYKPDFEPYYIEQSLDNQFEVTFSQALEASVPEHKHPPFVLDNKTPMPFCWDHPIAKKMLDLRIRDTSGVYQDFSHLISIDKIDSKVTFMLVPHDKGKHPGYGFQAVTVIENQSKRTVLKKYEKKNLPSKKTMNLEKNEEVQEEKRKKAINRELELSCRISHIGINLIQNTGGQTREVLYLTLRNLEFCRVDTKKTKTLQVKVRYLNIDNNHSYLVTYPVLLTPSENKKITKKGGYFLNFFVEQSLKHEEIQNYKAIKLDLEPFSIKIEDTLISVIIEFYTALAEVLWPKDVDKTEAINTRYFYQLDKNKRPQLWFWEKDEITLSNQQTFIDEFILSPIKLNLSFLTKTKGAEINSGLTVLTMFFKALGVALANIDDAPIKMSGLKLENCFDTTGGISTKLISHYKHNLTSEVFKLLGSINILGNPVGLFSQIGTGVQDLFEKPAEGFIKGPLEGGIGIVKGAGSLLKHTLAGTLNSVDKITGSLGTGIASLSLDEEYLAQRDKMKMQKAKHVGDGLKQAGMSIFTGFEKGITGVFMKPIEGASKGGVKGFFKGTFQGISGLIVKPVSGLLDAASKTAEGIKNTAVSGDDRPRETRERLLRVFYTSDKYYEDFDKKDAELNYFLQMELKKGRFVGSTYFYGYLFDEEGPKVQMVLFVTLENFIYFNKKTLKKKWIVNTSMVKNLEMKGKVIRIELKFKASKKQNSVEELVLADEGQREMIFKKLKEVLEIINDADVKN